MSFFLYYPQPGTPDNWLTPAHNEVMNELHYEYEALRKRSKEVFDALSELNLAIQVYNSDVKKLASDVKELAAAAGQLSNNLPPQSSNSVKKMYEIQMVYKLQKLLELL